MSHDARETWPSPELINSWLGDQEIDFEFRPGEDVAVPDDPEAVAAARKFRDVLGQFASGITVVTTTSNDEPVGMTCQSFSSVSLDPPLVLFIPAKSSRSWPLIQRSGRFCVNFLAADQAELSNTMASRGRRQVRRREVDPVVGDGLTDPGRVAGARGLHDPPGARGRRPLRRDRPGRRPRHRRRSTSTRCCSSRGSTAPPTLADLTRSARSPAHPRRRRSRPRPSARPRPGPAR